MPSELSLHLTEPNPVLAKAVKETPSGMAFWSGTGPEHKTCRECAFFDHQKSYYAKKGMGGGMLKPAKCKKYTAMTRQSGGNIPFSTRACKYFEQADVVPPVTSK